MKNIKFLVKTNTDTYPIIIGSNLVNNFSKLLNNNKITFDKCLLVIDKKVPNNMISILKKTLKKNKVFKFYFHANEKNKNKKSVDKIL